MTQPNDQQFDQSLLDAGLAAMQQGFSAQDLYWLQRNQREALAQPLKERIEAERAKLSSLELQARISYQESQRRLQEKRFDAEEQAALFRRWQEWMALKGRLLSMQEKAALDRENMDEQHRIAWERVRVQRLDNEARRLILEAQAESQRLVNDARIGDLANQQEMRRQQFTEAQRVNNARISDLVDQATDRALRRGTQDALNTARIADLADQARDRATRTKQDAAYKKAMLRQNRRGCARPWCLIPAIIVGILVLAIIIFLAVGLTAVLTLPHP